MEAQRYRLDDSDHDRIFSNEIEPYLFDGVSGVGERPSAVLVGGQPGSGKSRLLHMAKVAMGGDSPAVIINGDDLRLFHPNINEILDLDELKMPELTAYDSGRWVERSIGAAIARRAPMVIEGTFRNGHVAQSTVSQLVAADFEVDVWAVALHEWWSRLAIIHRYLDMRSLQGWGRWSDRAAHDGAYSGMASTVDSLARNPGVRAVNVMRRDGTAVYVAERVRLRHTGVARSPVEALFEERDRTWSETEMLQFIQSWDQCRALASDISTPTVVELALHDLASEVQSILGAYRP